ncbi:ultraviolet-B receptor UVR8 isoform X2 [Iris pallida]|uniref:Ultraviolet-B receptor UVR8 isoform X2 n=1 Tax=Iris pallida TaxID=29817 RepID=A0AAX6HV93_IRIPA|nr:ultraviolet-B receptor UVR8 isoform X2 [Iris pallida]
MEKLVADSEEKVWSFGAGTDGQLGTGTLQDQLLPQPLPDFPHAVAHIACGGAHAVALTGDGRVWTWGRGACGQLGHGEPANCLQPKLVQLLEPFAVSSVSAGWSHSGFVTDRGQLFMCGDGSFGQLGNGNPQSCSSPVEVPFFISKHVEQVACGMRHSLVLVRESLEGSVYGFGFGRHGQIGMSISGSGKPESSNVPRIIPGFQKHRILHICANGDQSAALSADGQLYTWGRGFGGRSLAVHSPRILTSSMRFSYVALGWKHALLLADGELYMLGGNRHGMLSRSQEATVEGQPSISPVQYTSEVASTLERVPCNFGEKAVCIAAGAEHSALVTEEGKVFTWGWGEHGQLGLGNTDDQISPQIVNIGYRRPICDAQIRVYCGSGFTFVVKP